MDVWIDVKGSLLTPEREGRFDGLPFTNGLEKVFLNVALNFLKGVLQLGEPARGWGTIEYLVQGMSPSLNYGRPVEILFIFTVVLICKWLQ